jgi:hypothetical protein
MSAQFNRSVRISSGNTTEAAMFFRFVLQLITGDKGLGVDPNG